MAGQTLKPLVPRNERAQEESISWAAIVAAVFLLASVAIVTIVFVTGFTPSLALAAGICSASALVMAILSLGDEKA